MYTLGRPLPPHWDGRPLFKGHETHTLSVEWTEQERAVSDLLTRYIQTSLAQASPAAALVVQLVMHTFHKIAASSWTALAQTLAQTSLASRLDGLFPGAKVELIHGDVEITERKAARVAFETGSRFLVSTEAGKKCINLQKACHLMINYDLP